MDEDGHAWREQLFRPKGREAKLELEQQILDLIEALIDEHPPYGRDARAKHFATSARENPAMWRAYISFSEDYWLAWKICQALIADLRRSDRVRLMESGLADWAFDVAEGRLTEPKRRGPDPWEKHPRNVGIALAVDFICDVGLRTATSGIDSACYLVAQRFGLAEKSVRTIWQEERRRREDAV